MNMKSPSYTRQDKRTRLSATSLPSFLSSVSLLIIAAAGENELSEKKR